MTTRVNVVFPDDLLEELRRLIPARKRSELIVKATAEKLAIIRQQLALKRAAGAWTDENHPDLNTPEDLSRWRRSLWASWDERIGQLGREDAQG